MNFKLRTIKGESKKLRKEWVCKPYRIVWRSEVQGVKVSPAYHAMVRITINDSEMWDFVGRRGPYKTLATAVQACEKHSNDRGKVRRSDAS